MYTVEKSFSGENITANKGKIIKIKDDNLANDLLNAGYIKKVPKNQDKITSLSEEKNELLKQVEKLAKENNELTSQIEELKTTIDNMSPKYESGTMLLVNKEMPVNEQTDTNNNSNDNQELKTTD